MRVPLLLATALSAGILASCDDTASPAPSAASDTASTARHPAELVGSWGSPAGDYAYAHLILRADGSGTSVGVSGSRRDAKRIIWSVVDTILQITDSTTRSTDRPYRVRGDSLLVFLQSLLGFRDTAVFVREPEPASTPWPGDRDAAIKGSWTGTLSEISGTMDDDDNWIPTDTTLVPDRFRFGADGTGENISYEHGYLVDTLPLGSTCPANSYCDSLTNQPFCDPANDGSCSYTAMTRHYEGYVPDDTTRFTWWTSGEDLYLGLWPFGATTPPSGFAGTQVVGWSTRGDSLLVRSYADTSRVQRYRREP